MTNTQKSIEVFQIPSTPLGTITFQLGPDGLTALGFFSTSSSEGNALSNNPVAKQITRQIRAYFSGEKVAFDFPVDLSALSDFQQKVLIACREIAYGEVETYGELAKRIGKPGAAQAIGGVMARNPIPLIIPCHRVVASGGMLHGYSAQGGLQTKSILLNLEGFLINNQQIIKDK